MNCQRGIQNNWGLHLEVGSIIFRVFIINAKIETNSVYIQIDKVILIHKWNEADTKNQYHDWIMTFIICHYSSQFKKLNAIHTIFRQEYECAYVYVCACINARACVCVCVNACVCTLVHTHALYIKLFSNIENNNCSQCGGTSAAILPRALRALALVTEPSPHQHHQEECAQQLPCWHQWPRYVVTLYLQH